MGRLFMVSQAQFEKNVQASFGYVKKDLLMVNDAISDIHEKIQHLSMNHATILGQMTKLAERIERLENGVAKKKAVKKVSKKAKKTPKKTAKGKPVRKVVKETVTYS